MRLNLPFLKRGLRRLVAGRPIDLRSLAVNEWTLCPAGEANTGPAIHLPGALDRITALSPWRSWEVERDHITGGTVTHAASIAYCVPDVELVGPDLYAGAARAQIGYGQASFRLAPEPAIYLDRANLVTSKSGSHFFGTLLLDDFPLALISEGDSENIAMVSKTYAHEAGYRHIAGLAPVATVTRARIGMLTIYVDFAQNQFKLDRYLALRARFRRSLDAHRRTNPGVYIRRGCWGEPRALVNESEVEQYLRRLGFDVVDPSAMTAVEIAERTLDARVVVGIEGSQLSHAIYTAADDATFLVLQPPDRFAMAYKEYTDRVGMRFAFLVGDHATGGFTIRLDEMERLLERVQS